MVIDGIYSDPYLFTTTLGGSPFPPAGSNLVIETAPNATGIDFSVGLGVGLYLDLTSVIFLDAQNNPLPGYFIIAAIYRTTYNNTPQNLTTKLDWTDSGNNWDDFIVLSPTGYKSSRTNSLGKAYFQSLSVMEVYDYQCFR